MKNCEKWMELCAQAANEQDSQKLMALIEQITALLEWCGRGPPAARVATVATTDLAPTGVDTAFVIQS